MGTDEQDAIIGRLTREADDLRRQLALIDAELTAFADGFASVAAYVTAHIRSGLSVRDARADQPIPVAVTKYADLTKLKELLAEQERLTAKFKQNRSAYSTAYPGPSTGA